MKSLGDSKISSCKIWAQVGPKLSIRPKSELFGTFYLGNVCLNITIHHAKKLK